MKYNILFILSLCSSLISAQLPVLIGRTTPTSATNTSVLLEFSNNNKGLIVPYIAGNLNSATSGTFYFDSTSKIMKLKDNSGQGYVDFTSAAPSTNAVIQPSGTDDATKKSVFGSTSSAVDGALVLESQTKVMVLPKVTNPHVNVVNPSAGMIVYDPTNKTLCTFNGTQWTFWTY